MGKKTNGLILLLFAVAILTGCSGRRGTVTIRVVATSDVHGRFYANDCIDGSEREGSMAKLSAFLKRERDEYRHLIYLDAGDILAGSIEIYHDITAEFYEPSLAATVYNMLGCDAAVFGNHDIKVGAEVYYRFLNGCNFPLLGANLKYDNYGDFLPPYVIIEKHGVKIAVVGMTTPAVNYTVPADIVGTVTVSDIVESAQYWLPIIRENERPDVVIGLLHSGYDNGRFDELGVEENAVRRLAAEVPGFDCLIYGHDHIPYEGKVASLDGDSVLVINPGPYASKAAVITVTAGFRKRELQELSVSGSLADLSAYEPDPDFARSLNSRYETVCHYADSVIGVLDVALDSRGALWGNTTAMDYIHYHQMRFQAAEVSIATPISSERIEAGNFTIRDAFRFYPFENNLVSVMMKGSEIESILEFSASQFYNTVTDGTEQLLRPAGPIGNSSSIGLQTMKMFMSAAGIRYVIDVTKPAGQRVSVISMSDGTPFVPDKYYRTTFNSHLAGDAYSPLYQVPGIARDDIRRRTVTASGADLRYYLITDFFVRQETGKNVVVPDYDNWRIIPEKIVNRYLSNE